MDIDTPINSILGLKWTDIMFLVFLSLLCSVSAEAQWGDTCGHLLQWVAYHPTDPATATVQYDTLRMYIERCAVSDSRRSWMVFSDISHAAYYMNNNPDRFESYRAWLISVLPLNDSQPEYFCNCVFEMGSTYQYGKYKVVGAFVIMDYLRTHHPECWSTEMDKQYSDDSVYSANMGYDLVHLPPLDSLGLGFLLPSTGVSSDKALTESFLASFGSSLNPFSKETRLRFHLNRISYVQVEIMDVLGSVVWQSNRYSYDEGDHEIAVDGKSLPDGILYARISTGFGEVKTVKLVKSSHPD